MRKALLILGIGIFLAGCKSVFSGKSEPARNTVTIKPTNYTFDDINAMAVPGCEIKKHDEEKTLTDTALENYNILLGHVESVLGRDYYVDGYGWDELRGSDTYFVWIVMKEWLGAYNNGESVAVYLGRRRVPDDSYSKYKGQYLIESGLEVFMMARKYTADLRNDFYAKYPDYRINTYYLGFEQVLCEPAPELFDKSDDYVAYFNGDLKSNAGKPVIENTLNVLLPPGTAYEDIDGIYGEMKAFLKEHYVTAVQYYVFRDEESRLEVIANEKEDNNGYTYDRAHFACGERYEVNED